MRLFLLVCLALALMSCSDSMRAPVQTLQSPNGDYKIHIYYSDPGACCSTAIKGELVGIGAGFSGVETEIFYIGRALLDDFELEWASPYSLQITVCDASSVRYESIIRSESGPQAIRTDIHNEWPTDESGRC